MSIKNLAFFTLALCLMASCKKNGGTGSSGNSNKLKQYIESEQAGGINYTDTFAVTYDNDNRITSLAAPNLKFLYTYQSKSFTLDLYENSALSIHEVSYLNGSSYVDSTFQYDDTNDTTTEGFIFNGAQLTSMITYSYSSYGTSVDSRDDYTYDNNGDVTKDTQTDGQGNVNMITTYTYTTDPLNVTINPAYSAQQSKYLPATQTLTDGSGNHLGTITYTYVFDGSKRLTKETDAADNGDVGVKTYVYE
jgi:hypothetical protein